LLTTSLNETTGTNLTIGETITIPMLLTIPCGTTSNATVTVTLPNSSTTGKLQALYGTVSTFPSNATSNLAQGSSATLTDANGDGILDTITFTLGNIIDSSSGSASNNITLLVAMLVSSDASTVRGKQLTTNATFTYSNSTSTFSLSDKFTVVVIEPSLVLTNAASSPTYVASGTVVQFTLTLNNTGSSNGPSYYVQIYDGLSSSYALNYGSVQTSAGTVTTGNKVGDATVLVSITALLSNASVTVTFNATLQDIVQPQTSVSNNASFQLSSALLQTYNSGNIRNQTGTANSSVTISSPTFSFQLNYTTVSDTPGTNVTIGEAASLVGTLSLTQVLL
jgi:hypothetical protein